LHLLSRLPSEKRGYGMIAAPPAHLSPHPTRCGTRVSSEDSCAAVTMALFGVLTFVDLPWLNGLTSSDLIHLTQVR